MEYSLRTVSLRKELWLFDFWCMPFCGNLTYHPTENIQHSPFVSIPKAEKTLSICRNSALADPLNSLDISNFGHS